MVSPNMLEKPLMLGEVPATIAVATEADASRFYEKANNIEVNCVALRQEVIIGVFFAL
jgi:hypothetical protein